VAWISESDSTGSIMVNIDETRVPWSKLEDAARRTLCSG
jgi:hypothetical protein